ncbi:hypothetical protein BDR04DRAFT_195008 [Suillus decipiens]|nr:hypothetical protein BDR04DRAFT_195008 [Suillus decipiens]
MERTPVLPDANNFCKCVWHYKIMLETTFGISVLEPWEKLVLAIVMTLLTVLFITGCARYLIPQQFVAAQHRLSYYLWGDVGGHGF